MDKKRSMSNLEFGGNKEDVVETHLNEYHLHKKAPNSAPPTNTRNFFFSTISNAETFQLVVLIKIQHVYN